MIEHAKWIWGNPETTAKDRYCIFRENFTAGRKSAVILQVSADTVFSACINGVRVPVTQFSDYPAGKTCGRTDITALLNDGENTVEITVHFLGEAFLTSRPGRACLKAVIFSGDEILAATGSDWQSLPDPRYRSGRERRVTLQLGYTFEYDARPEAPAETDWQGVYVYPDQDWWSPVKERPTAELLELDSPPVELCQHGWLCRTDFDKGAAEACAADYLRQVPPEKLFSSAPPCRSGDSYVRTTVELLADRSAEVVFRPLPSDGAANGYYLIADLKRETVGWPVIAVTAPAGTVIDIAHGEHLDDGRCKVAPDGRNFADRYICREGDNEFVHTLRRIGARYVELHITGFGDGEVRVRYAGAVPLELPLPAPAEFKTEDGLMTEINRISVDTLQLCMHEHYEDCPWREQALYGYDSRNQIHYGYYVWGNYDFAAASLDLLAGSYRGNGYLNLTAPGFHQLSIPSFTYAWISELREHWLFSGSGAVFERHMKLVDEILELALARRDAVDGLYHSAVAGFDGVWNFYEWRGKLSEVNEFPQSPYNIYLLEALRSTAAMHRWSGNEPRAAELEAHADAIGRACEAKFFDPAQGVYQTTLSGDYEPCELVQMLMLYNGLVPEQKVGGLLDAVYSRKLRKLTYSSLFYMLNAMMEAGPEARAYADCFLMSEFSGPVLSGATSLWETEFGSRDFNGAGSLCHAWSSIMPYYSGAYLLGVKPLEPGFKTFELKIYPGHLTHASGSVPTPHGEIDVSWRMREDRSLDVKVRAPDGLKMTVAQYDEFPIAEIRS
jgi:hypothetical protein